MGGERNKNTQESKREIQRKEGVKWKEDKFSSEGLKKRELVEMRFEKERNTERKRECVSVRKGEKE